jgi:L-malate glycosyltransferase
MTEQLVIVQRRLTHYRVPLFVALRERLAAEGVALSVVVGQGTADENSKADQGELPGAVPVKAHYALGGRLCWLALGHTLRDARLLVLPQELKHLNNLRLLLAPQPFRVALWGHGTNRQASGWQRPAQALKQALTARADWGFAYTESAARQMQPALPAARISVLNNAIDTRGLQAQVAAARELGRAELRRALGVGSGPLALFMGSLYNDKRLDLLLDAAERVRAQQPDFQLVVCGAGPLAPWLAQRCTALPWVHRPGPVSGESKARWLAAADLMLNPGLVGLGLLDAFAAGLPFITSDCGVHSPEIDYLEPGHNGLMCAPTAAAVAAEVLRVLREPALAQTLAAQAQRSAARYTLPAMVERFAAGVLAWRGSAPRRGGL